MDRLSEKQGRLNHLDVIKGICVLFVIITHYSWNNYQRLRFGFPFWIDMAVPIFLVITGYVSALSFKRKKQGLKEAYRPKNLLAKWLRFLIPFIPVYIAEILYLILAKKEMVSIKQFILYFLTGGIGPGSYYMAFMLQIILIMPLIYLIIRKMRFKGLFICFMANLAYEVLKTVIHLSPEIYRLCVFRHLFITAYGCWLFFAEEAAHKKTLYWIAGALGIIYIIIFNYTGIRPVITDQWTTTSMFAAMLIIPVMKYLFDYRRLHQKVFEVIGRASFDVFLIQMLYYTTFSEIIRTMVNNTFLTVLINIFICCTAGLLYYRIESPLTRKIIWLINR